MQIELRSPQKERVRERGRAAIEVENHVECCEEGCAGDGIGGGGEDAGGGSVLPNDGMPTAESACEQILHAADCIDPWLLPSSQPPDFQWGSYNGEAFCASVAAAYDEAVHWKRNIFLLPSGNVGKSFIQEMTWLLNAFVNGSTIECVSLKALFIMQMLLLQKPARKSKMKDHINHLQRWLELWRLGNIQEGLGKCIQKYLRNWPRPSDDEAIACTFGRMMEQGKVHMALRFLSRKTSGGVLKLDDLVPAQQIRHAHCPGHSHRQTSCWTATHSTFTDWWHT